MTAEEVLVKAEQEGLTLVRSDNKMGYKNVTFHQGKMRPYQLKIKVVGRQQHFGYYATAEEAALAYAQHVGKEQAAQEAAQEAAEAAPPMTLQDKMSAVVSAVLYDNMHY